MTVTWTQTQEQSPGLVHVHILQIKLYQCHLSHGTNGPQGLSSEAVRLQMPQILVGTDLWSEMPDGHHCRVCSFDSMSIITDFYALQTIVLLQFNKQCRLFLNLFSLTLFSFIYSCCIMYSFKFCTSLTSTLEAPASSEFSSSSLTTLSTDVMTWELDRSRTVSGGSCFII